MGLILSLDNSIHSFNRAGFVGLLDEYTGAAAAYSLRRLSVNTTNVVRVRRSSDNAEADFTATEIIDGTLEDWVNTDVVKYTSDFSSTENLAEFNGTGAAAQSVGGVDDAYKFTLSGGNVQHTVFTSTSILQSGKSFTIVFDYYIPSGQTLSSIVFDNFGGSGAISGSLNVTDNWTTETINFTADGTRPRWWAGALGANVNADGDVFYLKNIVVTQTTADGHVTTWYDQAGSNDATQATASSQPKIVDAGVLVEENGKVAVSFDGTDDFLSNTLPSTISQPTYWFVTHNFHAIPSAFDGIISNLSGDLEHRLILDGSLIYTMQAGGSIKYNGYQTSQSLISYKIDASDERFYFNGSEETASSGAGIGSNGLESIILGTFNQTSGHTPIQFQEIILYPSDQSSNRTGIETNINDYYNIYP